MWLPSRLQYRGPHTTQVYIQEVKSLGSPWDPLTIICSMLFCPLLFVLHCICRKSASQRQQVPLPQAGTSPKWDLWGSDQSSVLPQLATSISCGCCSPTPQPVAAYFWGLKSETKVSIVFHSLQEHWSRICSFPLPAPDGSRKLVLLHHSHLHLHVTSSPPLHVSYKDACH